MTAASDACPSPSGPPPRLKLRSPLDLVEAIPFLFGYHPAESLVVLGLRKGRVGMSMRLDLCPDQEMLIDSVVDFFRSEWPEQILAVVYDCTCTPAPALAAGLRTRFNDEGVGVREVALVRSGRCYSLMCSNDRCCPREGWPLPEPDPLMVSAMAATLGADVPLSSRDSLVARLQPVQGAQAERMRDALDTAAADFEARVNSGMALVGQDGVKAALASIDRAAAKLAPGDGRQPLSDADAASLIVAMLDPQVRDMAIAHTVARKDEATYEEVWVELTRRAVDDWAAPVATAAALFAWQRGSGTRARVAVERALDADPQYRLALLLEHALDVGMPPALWGESLRELLR